MADIKELTEDLAIIQKLGDNPNTDDGLSASELKAKFDAAPQAIKNYINEVLVPAVNTSLKKDGTTPAAADFPMGGHKVTGMASPENDGDAVNLGYANKNFAPAGYGLGGYAATKGITSVAELDSYKSNGKFAITQTIGTPLYLESIPFNTLLLEVSMINANYGTQLVRFLEGYVIRRRCSNGVWQPWEWINTPMVAGKEYRLLEKTNDGKAVYAKRISYTATEFGSATAAYDLTIAHNCNLTNLVRCFCYKDTYPLPMLAVSGGLLTINQVSANAVVLRAYKLNTSGTFVFDLYYTKD